MRCVIILTLLATTACPSADDQAEAIIEAVTGTKIDIDGKTVTIVGKDGEKTTITQGKDGVTTMIDAQGGTMTMGLGKLPKGFPLAIFEGAEVSMGMTADREGMRHFTVTLTTSASPDVVGAFYEKELQNQGMKVDKTAHALTGTPMVILRGRKGKGKEKIVSGVNITGDGEETVVIISWSEPG